MGPAPARVGLLAAFVLTLTEAAAMDIRALWDFDDPARAEAVFREHLARARGDDALSLQTQIARTYGLRSRFADAHALLDRMEPELAAAGPEPQVRHLLERGRTWRSAGQVDRARPLFLQAVDQAATAGLEDLAIDAMHMMALVEAAPAERMRWNRRALAAAQQASDPAARNWDASLANNIGMTLHDEGRFEEALASFRSALAARERIGRPAGIRVAQWMIAWTLRSLGRHEEALVILYLLERGGGAAAAAPDGFVAEEIAENLLAQGQAHEARPWFAQAHALLSQASALDRPDEQRLARLLELSR